MPTGGRALFVGKLLHGKLVKVRCPSLTMSCGEYCAQVNTWPRSPKCLLFGAKHRRPHQDVWRRACEALAREHCR